MFKRLAMLTAAITAAAGLLMATNNASAAPSFRVLAFYNGTWDAAHIDFVKEARVWFPATAAQNGFEWESTSDWSRMNSLSAYQVVMFLDDLPPAAYRGAFQNYMQNGGAWMGFHVSAFNTDPNQWSWYHNTFLGTGAFRNNTWGPTAETLKTEKRDHPSTLRLPATFQSSVSEWYSWTRDLRQNTSIDILASIDTSSFPVGTDPNQTWYSGYYPIIWTNRAYKMLYANFGHNAMNYSTNTRLSSTFDSEVQNRWLIDGLLWLGGGTAPSPTPSPTTPSSWVNVVNKGSGKCVDARAAGTANGTVIQQYTCNNGYAQQFQLQATSGGYARVNNRNNSSRVWDVTGVSTSDNAGIQLWTYGGGNNQQWLAVSEGGGYYHFVNRHSGKCLDVPGASTANSVQLVQYTCNGTAAQSFRYVSQP
ncbi:RICIN domain-containing protein [Catelliglobosispora koreensis]|uniref:RICIN domain-containing protein n=1 Tax=Catelliglobosispora koreensis TaxID=129052 RepID=UPI00039B9C54|nr:RICIN domain-containing protein [Catelliglobosispora koreensis]